VLHDGGEESLVDLLGDEAVRRAVDVDGEDGRVPDVDALGHEGGVAEVPADADGGVEAGEVVDGDSGVDAAVRVEDEGALVALAVGGVGRELVLGREDVPFVERALGDLREDLSRAEAGRKFLSFRGSCCSMLGKLVMSICVFLINSTGVSPPHFGPVCCAVRRSFYGAIENDTSFDWLPREECEASNSLLGYGHRVVVEDAMCAPAVVDADQGAVAVNGSVGNSTQSAEWSYDDFLVVDDSDGSAWEDV